jgi:hypothetical protein
MNNNEQNWLVEPCFWCGTTNHIFLCNNGAHAWECWNCYEVWWLDDLSKHDFMLEQAIDDDKDADTMLYDYHPGIVYLHGQQYRSEN